MLHPSARLRDSKIEGKGLVAKELIPKGSIFWRFSPTDRARKYSIEEYKKFTPRYQKILDRYTYPDGHDSIIYSGENDKYWNHSCNANVLDYPASEMCIVVRDIQPGEEITYDSGQNLREGLQIECKCREISCRKIIRKLNKNSVTYKELKHKVAAALKYKNKVKQPLLVIG